MLNSEVPTDTRSMARISLRLAAFLLPLVLAWAAIEWWSAKVPTTYSTKRERLNALSDRIDTLILGSSSAFFGIAPKLLSGTAFNLADVSQTLYYDDQLLSQVLPQLPHLRRVIVPIQYVSLSFELNDSFEPWRQYFYEQAWGIPPMEFKERMDIRMWSRVALFTPREAFAMRPSLRGLARGALVLPTAPAIMDDHGWFDKVSTDNDPARLNAAAGARRLAQHHTKEMNARYEEANLAYLTHIVSLLHEHHVECVLITLPVWKTYRDGMRADLWNETQRHIQDLVKTWGVQYLSFLDLPEMEEGDFLDVDHLNTRGAVRFTKILNAELQRTAGPSAAPAPQSASPQ